MRISFVFRLFIALIFLLSVQTTPGESVKIIKAKFLDEYNGGKEEVGHTFRGTIVFWPLDKTAIRGIKNVEGKNFSEKLYVVKVYNVKVSKNNAEAVKLSALFTVTEPFSKSKEVKTKLGDMEVTLKLPSFEVVSDGGESSKKQFIYINQETVTSSYVALWMSIVLMALILGGYFIRRSLLQKREAKRIKDLKQKWKERFKEAKTREQLEDIYAQRDEWLQLADMMTPPIHALLEHIKEIQYKKEWTKEDLKEAKDKAESVEDIFDSKREEK